MSPQDGQLAARGQLRTISDLASNDGLRVVVLKGGVAVNSGFDLDLEDLDFLLPPDHARQLEAGLLQAGYWSQRGGSPAVARGGIVVGAD